MDEMYGVGWVSADVINNVFTEAKAVLEDRLWPKNETPDRREVVQFLDSIKHRIFARAVTTRHNVAPSPRLTAPRPAATTETTDETDTQPVDSRGDYLAHAARSRSQRPAPE